MDTDEVKRILDRQEIIDGMHWYTRWVDLNRVDKQVEIFTDNAKLTFYGEGHWIEGRKNIEATLVPSVARYEATHHYISNIEISFEGLDMARSISYVQAWHRPVDGGEDYTLHAQYHDQWVRTPDGWRLNERRLKTSGTTSRSQGPDLERIGRSE